MTETYREQQDVNSIDAQKDKDIDMILELKKIQWALINEGYIPTIEEAINRIAKKWAKEDVEEEETMESMMDDDSGDESFSSMCDCDTQY